MNRSMLGIKGKFDIIVRNPDGSVATRRESHNIVTNSGVAALFALLAGGDAYVTGDYSTATRLSHVALGDGGTIPIDRAGAWSDTLLTRELDTGGTSDNRYARVACANAVLDNQGAHDEESTIMFSATFVAPFVGDTGSATRYLNEVGLFNAAGTGAGTLYAVSTYTAITVTHEQNVEVRYTLSVIQAT